MNRDIRVGVLISVITTIVIVLFAFSCIEAIAIKSIAKSTAEELYAYRKFIAETEGGEFDQIQEMQGIREDEELRELVEKNISKSYPSLLAVSLVAILILIFTRGWTNLRNTVVAIDFKAIAPMLSASIAQVNLEPVRWYIGRKTFSYNSFKKRMVVGPDFMSSKEDQKDFIVLHEYAHLIQYDSIIKNTLINTTRLFVPLVVILYILQAMASNMASAVIFDEEFVNAAEPVVDQSQAILLVLGTVFPIASGIVLFVYWKKFLFWFSKVKELVADSYANNILSSDLVLDFAEGKYHPSAKERREGLRQGVLRIEVSSFILLLLVLLNFDYNQMFLVGELYYLVLFFLAVLFLLFGILFSRALYVTSRGFLTVLIVGVLYSLAELAHIYYTSSFTQMASKNIDIVVVLASNVVVIVLMLILMFRTRKHAVHEGS